ncbi:hypothetical protein [Parolsenella catena]|uniref:hypothetical protein n=1 Tax=Parolsenella catena TaxID=2003188 RepID=UPI002FDD8F04
MEELARAAVQWAVPVVLAALAASLMRLYRLIDAMQEGTRTMLRSRLVDLHARYVVSGKGCPDWVKREASQVYAAYHGMGGNGTGTHYFEEIIEAPIRGESED